MALGAAGMGGDLSFRRIAHHRRKQWTTDGGDRRTMTINLR